MRGTKLDHRNWWATKGIALDRKLEVLELQGEEGGDPVDREDPEDREETELNPLKPKVKPFFGGPENGFIKGSQVGNIGAGLFSLLHIQLPFVYKTSKALVTSQRKCR